MDAPPGDVLLQTPDTLEAADAALREALCRTCLEGGGTASLAHAFGQLVRERWVEALDPWLVEAEANGVRELRRFALGLRQDYAVVRAALEQPWSQGRPEGHGQLLTNPAKGQMRGSYWP
jgi:hypothetical protein